MGEAMASPLGKCEAQSVAGAGSVLDEGPGLRGHDALVRRDQARDAVEDGGHLCAPGQDGAEFRKSHPGPCL